MPLLNLRFFLRLWCLFTSALAYSGHAAEFKALEISGNETTLPKVIEDLLPRPLPGALDEAEIIEFGRRAKNLGIFDRVALDSSSDRLKIDLRRKRTLTPSLGFSSGKTLEDSSITAGLQDYDFDGAATRIGGKIGYAERGINFAAWIDEHTYSPNRWANEFEIYRQSSGFRFENDLNSWSRNRAGGFAEWVSPFHYGSFLLYEFQLMSYYENFSNTRGPQALKDGIYTGGLFEIIYDRYRWDDLVPGGYKLVVEFRPGVMSTGDFRGEARFKFNSAIPLGDKSSMVMNGNFAVVNPGNANHSLLIGSQQGVRGLSDSLFRSAFVNYANLEFRHSLTLSPRTYLQSVIFSDAGIFRTMDASGNLTPWTHAISTGLGIRLIPTRLTNLLFRADLARLFVPTQSWTLLFGITQYI